MIRTAAEGLLPEVGPVAQIPPQNDNAIAFQADTDGKIGLFNVQHYNALRDDEDTKDRYKECIQLAKDALDRCDRSNAASRLVGFLNNYIDAAGGKVADLRPSLFVQRGERLRQEISAYQLHDTMLPPLADDILLDLRTWRSAHNMLVGLDPALMARDTALFGPEDRVADVPPQEIEALAVDASEAGLLAENVLDIVLEATKLAPDIPDPKNRRTIWSFETGRNLVIEAFSVALRNPVKSLAGALVLGSAISTVGVAGSVLSVAGGSMPAARFLLRHREWIETRLGDTPTWKELFASVCEWMKGNTPPDPKN